MVEGTQKEEKDSLSSWFLSHGRANPGMIKFSTQLSLDLISAVVLVLIDRRDIRLADQTKCNLKPANTLVALIPNTKRHQMIPR